MILTSVVFPFARWGCFMCGGVVWAGSSPQRKPPLSCLTLRLFLAEMKMSSAIHNLSSHLFVSSSVFWKISHSDLNVFLACLPRHGFLIARASVIFFSVFYWIPSHCGPHFISHVLSSVREREAETKCYLNIFLFCWKVWKEGLQTVVLPVKKEPWTLE